MTWTENQYKRIQHLLPKPRKKAEVDNLTFLRALQYMAENGCRWRAMPEKFGKWDTIYQRFRRWIHKGVFDRIEKELQSQFIDIKGIKTLALDSTYVKVHPDGTGAPKKKGLNPSGKVAADERQKSTRSLPMSTFPSPVNCLQVRHRMIVKAKN